MQFLRTVVTKVFHESEEKSNSKINNSTNYEFLPESRIVGYASECLGLGKDRRT